MKNIDSRILVWAIIISQIAPPFMVSGVAVALPMMGSELQAGATSLGLVETLFLAGQLAFLLPMGRLADASDKRTLYKLSLLGFGLASLLISLLSSMTAILFLRFLQGIASAMSAATGHAILADIVPKEQRGKAFGRSIGAIYIGLTLGPMMAGFLIDLWGWQSVFLIGAGALFFGYGVIHALMPSTWKRPPAKSVHLPSTILVVAAVLSLVASSSALHFGPMGYILLVGGIVLAALFVRLQYRLDEPLVDFRALVGNPPLRNALLAQLLLYVNAFSTVFILSLFMQVSQGHSASLVGQIIALGSLCMGIMAPIAGTLASRFFPHLILNVGVLLVLVATWIGVGLSEHSSLLMVALLLAIQGWGFAWFSTPNMMLIMGSVPPTKTGMASALAAKARALGMVSGMLIMAVLLSFSFGNDPVTEHADHLIEPTIAAFSTMAALTALAFLICFFTRNPRIPAEEATAN